MKQPLSPDNKTAKAIIKKFTPKLSAIVIKANNEDGICQLKFNCSSNKLLSIIQKIGKTSLSPYIKPAKTQQEKQ